MRDYLLSPKKIISLASILMIPVAALSMECVDGHSSGSENKRRIAKSIEAAKQEVIYIDDNHLVETPRDSCSMANSDEVFVAVEENPDFPGGLDGLKAWLMENAKIPVLKDANATQKRGVVVFVVWKDGSVGDAKVVERVNTEFDAECLRLVNTMPKWNPGKNCGANVNSYFMLPFYYKLH